MKRKNICVLRLAAAFAAVFAAAHADSLAVKMLPGEHWWGLCNNFGRDMPFTEKSSFTCDLRKDNYSHQSLSFLCSDRGRAVWCAEPVGVTVMVDRSTEPVDFGIPFRALLKLSLKTYQPDECPLCKSGMPIDHPGSK